MTTVKTPAAATTSRIKTPAEIAKYVQDIRERWGLAGLLDLVAIASQEVEDAAKAEGLIQS